MVTADIPFLQNIHPFLTPLQKRVREKIRHFDTPSLLKLLYSMGYHAKDIYFASNPSLVSSPSLFEDILFLKEEYPKIVIVINLGLLTANSPLPTYFRKKLENGFIDPLLFSRFLSFFDHHLILMILATSFPYNAGGVFSNWSEVLTQYLSFLALDSTSTLWLLLQLCFPELKVEICKFARVLHRLSSSIILGSTRLGEESYLGKSQKLTISSFQVTLTSDEMDYNTSVPWPVEIKKRLKETLFPIIHRINIYMKVILVVRNCKDALSLSPTSHLGYRSLGANSQRPLSLLLFSGYPKI